LLNPGVYHAIHRLDLHFGDALRLCASNINDLLWPSQRRGGLSHPFDYLFAVFLAAFGRLAALLARVRAHAREIIEEFPLTAVRSPRRPRPRSPCSTRTTVYGVFLVASVYSL
jgi:hypothetical protein